MEHLLEVLQKEGLKVESDNNAAVSEEGLKSIIEQHKLDVNLDELMNKKLLRRIKTNDNSIYFLFQPPFSQVTQKRKLSLEKEKENKISALEEENKRLQEELGLIDHGMMYNEYIELLHEYNELKDVVQALLGRLAMVRNMTTRELYPEFDLNPKD